jgi:hypothetical protein
MLGILTRRRTATMNKDVDEVSEVGRLIDDHDPGLLMGTLSKPVQYCMEIFLPKLIWLD